MQSAEFASALDELMAAATAAATAIMCSEALPQKCHRRLIADALLPAAGASAIFSRRRESRIMR